MKANILKTTLKKKKKCAAETCGHEKKIV